MEKAEFCEFKYLTVVLWFTTSCSLTKWFPIWGPRAEYLLVFKLFLIFVLLSLLLKKIVL